MLRKSVHYVNSYSVIWEVALKSMFERQKDDILLIMASGMIKW